MAGWRYAKCPMCGAVHRLLRLGRRCRSGSRSSSSSLRVGRGVFPRTLPGHLTIAKTSTYSRVRGKEPPPARGGWGAGTPPLPPCGLGPGAVDGRGVDGLPFPAQVAVSAISPLRQGIAYVVPNTFQTSSSVLHCKQRRSTP